MICLPTEGPKKGVCNYTVANSCLDITNPIQCNSASPGFAEYFYNRIIYNDGGEHCHTNFGFSYITGCWNETSCRCFWNETSCIGALNYSKKCINIEPEQYGACENSVIDVNDNCEAEGYYTYNIKSIWTGTGTAPGDCPIGLVTESRVACGTVAKLGFFGIFNVICVIISLIIIYCFYFLKEKNHNKIKSIGNVKT